MDSDPNPPPGPGPLLPPEVAWYRTPFFRRLIALFCPPLGWWILYRDPELPRRTRWIEGTIVWVYCLPYLLAGLLVLDWAGVIGLEWKGGFGPTLVRRKSGPNYLALEQHRVAQKSAEPAPSALPVGPAPYWTNFRGPRRDGHYREQPILTAWPAEGPPLLWRQPVGGGYASLVVANGRVFTLEQRRENEAVTAYDLETGRELWAYDYPAHFSEWMGGEGPRATPTYDDGFLYSQGAAGLFACLGAESGRLLWKRDVLAENGSTNLFYGLANSPLVVDDKVVVLTGGATQGRSVVAYHRLTGDPVWHALDDPQAYVSPLLVDLAGERQLLIVTARRAVGLRPDNGALLWEYPWRVPYDNAIAVPVVVGSDRFVLSAGYGVGAALVQVGKTNGTWSVREMWRNRNLKTKFNAGVFWQDHLYGLDEGVLACVDVTTGDRRWREGRYGYGQILLASGHLLVLGGDGLLALVRPDPAGLDERMRMPALTGKTWNVPALAHGRLLVRNSAEMACYDLRPASGTKPAPSTGAAAATP